MMPMPDGSALQYQEVWLSANNRCLSIVGSHDAQRSLDLDESSSASMLYRLLA
jgi:hypothetical protein